MTTFKELTHELIRDKSLAIIIDLTQKRELFTNMFHIIECGELLDYLATLKQISRLLGIEKE